MTLAPKSASCRTQVGPARTRVRSRTVKRVRAFEARGNGMVTGVSVISYGGPVARLEYDPDRSAAQVDMDVLLLGERQQLADALLAADARLLVAAKRRTQEMFGYFVDPD